MHWGFGGKGMFLTQLKLNNMKTNYDKLFDVLIEWYTEEQVNEIWKMLKEYDKKINLGLIKIK